MAGTDDCEGADTEPLSDLARSFGRALRVRLLPGFSSGKPSLEVRNARFALGRSPCLRRHDPRGSGSSGPAPSTYMLMGSNSTRPASAGPFGVVTRVSLASSSGPSSARNCSAA